MLRKSSKSVLTFSLLTALTVATLLSFPSTLQLTPQPPQQPSPPPPQQATHLPNQQFKTSLPLNNLQLLPPISWLPTSTRCSSRRARRTRSSMWSQSGKSLETSSLFYKSSWSIANPLLGVFLWHLVPFKPENTFEAIGEKLQLLHYCIMICVIIKLCNHCKS